MHLLTLPIPDPPVYLMCNPTLCALKQPRDFCCVCVEAKEVPALLLVKILWKNLGWSVVRSNLCGPQDLWGKEANLSGSGGD